MILFNAFYMIVVPLMACAFSEATRNIPSALELAHSNAKNYYAWQASADPNETDGSMEEYIGQNEYLYLPRIAVTNQDLLVSVGLSELVVKGKLFKLPDGCSNMDSQNLTIPYSTNLLFSFDSPNALNKSLESSKTDALEMIKNLPPFRLPSLFRLYNYYLILPSAYIEDDLGANYTAVKQKLSYDLQRKSLKNCATFYESLDKDAPSLVLEFETIESQSNSNSTIESSIDLTDHFLVNSTKK